ncbi:hypothetical protein SLS62_011405 [Diatrype stigma]|uniref:Enoyl reductase (ER) domain-containing protein n=1 Tax=Diatrype stigma TaxID=117547 RepID=A0AAN9YDP9_9PEZI
MPVPEKFNAAVVPEPGAQNIVTERSLAPLEDGEVAIRITATAINPVDWKMRDYKVFLSSYPAVLGSDAAGEIAEVGPGVSGFAPGDRVFFQGIIGKYDASTFQQYCRMPAALVAKTPRNITDDEASGVSLASVAVLTAFYDTETGHGLTPPWAPAGDKVGEGKSIVILGGSSSVGQYAIQLARLSGFSRIVTNSSAAHRAHLEALGAHVVLDRATHSAPEDFAAAVTAAGAPLALVLDAISVESTQALGVRVVHATRAAGAHVYVVQPPAGGEVPGLCASGPVATSVRGVLGLGSGPKLRYLSEPLMAHLGGEDGYIARGLFRPNRPAVVPGGLAAVETALAKNKNGVSGEKVVIRPWE